MPLMTPDEEVVMLLDGHPEACVAYWRDVMTADTLQERWDHWVVPPCPVCKRRRKVKKVKT